MIKSLNYNNNFHSRVSDARESTLKIYKKYYRTDHSCHMVKPIKMARNPLKSHKTMKTFFEGPTEVLKKFFNWL